MKTTIDIPDEELEEVMKLTGAKTKKEAVVTAIVDFNRRRRLERVIAGLGTFDDVMTQDDLREMRDDDRDG